jgi:hypothetical protein
VLKQKFGPILVLISSNPEPFLTYGDWINGASELLGYISGKANLGIKYPRDDSIMDALLDILQSNEVFKSDPFGVLSKITRAFFAETSGCSFLEVVECATLDLYVWRYNEKSECTVYVSYLDHKGETNTFDFTDMFDGNDTHILISDPQNLELRLKALAKSFDFTNISDDEDRYLLFTEPKKLAELLDARDKR